MRQVNFSDVTMKEAANVRALGLSFKKKLEIAKLLDRLGVSSIEIEGIEKAKADSLRIKSIASNVRNSTLVVPVKLDDAENVELVYKAAKAASKLRLQVQASVSPAQMEYTYRKKADGMLSSIEAAVAECAKYTENVEFVAEDATRSDLAFLAEAVKRAVGAGARIVTLSDAAGKMLPEEFSQFITEAKEKIPELSEVALGISCSDDLSMADVCAVAGIMAGVDEVKTASYPLNVVSTERLAYILANKADVCQASCTVHVSRLKRSVQQIAWMCEDDRTKASVFANTSEEDETIVLTANDTKESVLQCVARLGYDLSDEDATNVYESFVRIAAKKDVVGSRELDAIVASAALQVPETYILKNYVINSGSPIRATACIHMEKGEEVLEGVGVGAGPIDAAFAAIEGILGKRYELDDFQIQSVTEGQEAMGEAVVKLIAEGKVFSGRGISTDIIGSSIRAYINALNKIVYEEQN